MTTQTVLTGLGIFAVLAVAFALLRPVAARFIAELGKGWNLGPTIDGKNYSTGSVNGNVITVQDAHYITKAATGPLTGTMSVTFNLSAPLTGTATPENGCGPAPATVTLYFQQAGDNWETDGKRWWAKFATVTLDHAGDYTMTVPMDGAWTSVQDMTAANNPQAFADAKANPSRVGFTIGNCTGLGHGGTGPAVLTIQSFNA